MLFPVPLPFCCPVPSLLLPGDLGLPEGMKKARTFPAFLKHKPLEQGRLSPETGA